MEHIQANNHPERLFHYEIVILYNLMANNYHRQMMRNIWTSIWIADLHGENIYSPKENKKDLNGLN